MDRKTIVGIVALAALLLLAGTAMAASGPESIPAGPVCAAAAAEPPALAFLELPDGQANPEPLYMVCNPTCTAACNAAFNSCMADCSPTYPGDPCATGCRNAKIICYQGCC